MGEGAPVNGVWVGTPCYFLRLRACFGGCGMPDDTFDRGRGRPLLTASEWAAWLIPLAGLVVVEPCVGSAGQPAVGWTRVTGLWLGLFAIRVGWRWIAARSRKESGS